MSAQAESRQPPHDLGAERATLGAMLLSHSAVDDIAEIVSGEDFYHPVHATIFRTIMAERIDGKPADAVTIAAALACTGDLVKVGGAPYLGELMAEVPTAANGPYYARIVEEKALYRRLAEAGTRIAQLGYAQGGEIGVVSDALDVAQQTILDVASKRESGEFSVLSDMLQPTLDIIEAAAGGDSGPSGLPTGFTDLDRLLTGLHPGQLVVVAGRPGMGKSTLATDIVRNVAVQAGLPAAIFSLEMSKPEIVTRILSAESRVPLHHLRSGQLTEDDWTKLARRIGEIAEAPIFVDDTPSMNLMDIRVKAHRLKQQKDVRLVVVDYLQLLSSGRRSNNRQEEVADLSRSLKVLAKEIECPVIAVSQLNRGPEQRQDKRPTKADLRESGAIEQDADVVILVHRDDYYDKESPRAGEADFIVDKSRLGPEDTVTVASQLHLARFVDMAIV